MCARVAIEEQQEARKAQLVKATLREVSEKGFSNVTLGDIAVRAGLSKGVALYYFESKEELFLAAFDRFIGTLRGKLRAAIDAAPGPVEKVIAILDTTFVSARENRDFYRAYLDFLSLGTRNPDFHQLNARFYKGCADMDHCIVEEGIRQGLFRPGSDPTVIRAIFDGLMFQWLFDNPDSFANYRRRCESAIFAYLRG